MIWDARRWAILSAVVLGVASPGWTKPMPDTEAMLSRAKQLTAPELAGRGAGSPGYQRATELVAHWLEEGALEPAFAGSWFQPFPLSGQGWTGNDLTGFVDRNVCGLAPGRGKLAGRYIVIGAHLDHLGRVDPVASGTAVPAPEAYYPGANDNASGVTVVTEIMRMLTTSRPDQPDARGVLFAFFGAEEAGLQGSAFFVDHLPVPPDSIDVMINFDTVGQIEDDRLYVSGVGSSPNLAEMATGANTGKILLSLGEGGWSGSDHMNFDKREIPALFVFGGAYAEYNRPADTWDTLTPAGLTMVARYGWRLARMLRARPGPLPWVRGAPADSAINTPANGNRDTWFGSLPDFASEIEGYCLGGVFPDSPAARAGLQKGDVLVRLAGRAVKDLAGFTVALRSHAPGDLVEVEVLRGGKSMRFTVVLGNRADRN